VEGLRIDPPSFSVQEPRDGADEVRIAQETRIMVVDALGESDSGDGAQKAVQLAVALPSFMKSS
jgi:hypothetical protein